MLRRIRKTLKNSQKDLSSKCTNIIHIRLILMDLKEMRVSSRKSKRFLDRFRNLSRRYRRPRELFKRKNNYFLKSKL